MCFYNKAWNNIRIKFIMVEIREVGWVGGHGLGKAAGKIRLNKAQWLLGQCRTYNIIRTQVSVE